MYKKSIIKTLKQINAAEKEVAKLEKMIKERKTGLEIISQKEKVEKMIRGLRKVI